MVKLVVISVVGDLIRGGWWLVVFVWWLVGGWWLVVGGDADTILPCRHCECLDLTGQWSITPFKHNYIRYLHWQLPLHYFFSKTERFVTLFETDTLSTAIKIDPDRCMQHDFSIPLTQTFLQ